MSKIMKNNSVNKLFRKYLLTGLSLMIIAIANIAVSAQFHPDNCPLVVSSVTGDVAAFSIAGDGTTSFSIKSTPESDGVMASVIVASSVNANVTIVAAPIGTDDPAIITASKIDLNQSASFVLTVTDTVGHTVTVNVIANCPIALQGCTRTQGFYKNKPNEWAVQSLTLGSVTYTQTELLSILKTSVRGNGLISLSHQLIAAKLNVASGASVPVEVATAIAAADALIGSSVVPPIGGGSSSTASTSSLTSILDAYNNGLAPGGPPHCDD